MRIGGWVALALASSGGGCGGVREVRTPNGETVFAVDCEGDGAKCASAARSKCSEGFGVIEESETTSGPHSMTFRCQRKERPREEQAAARSGPSLAEGIGAALVGGMRGASEGFANAQRQQEEAREQCRNDFECRGGEVCSKPVGKMRGQCMKALNENGTPIYFAPRPDSAGPGERQCTFSTECGPSFDCVEGRCVRP